MAEQFPYIKFYVQDFLASSKVDLMCTRAIGAYILLLCKAWHQSPPATLPDDDSMLARWARLSLEDWMEVRGAVLGAFTVEDGRWKQSRLRDEYDLLVSERRGKSTGGKKSAAARAAKILPRVLEDTSKLLDIHQSQNQSQNQKEPRGEPPFPPTPWVAPIHPTERHAVQAEASAILQAFPTKERGNRALAAVQDALVRVRRGSDIAWPSGIPPPADAAAWLLGRVRAYAASGDVRAGFTLSVVRWMDEAKYLDLDECWNRKRQDGKGAKDADVLERWLAEKTP